MSCHVCTIYFFFFILFIYIIFVVVFHKSKKLDKGYNQLNLDLQSVYVTNTLTKL